MMVVGSLGGVQLPLLPPLSLILRTLPIILAPSQHHYGMHTETQGKIASNPHRSVRPRIRAMTKS